MALAYALAGLGAATTADPALVRALQQDLRALGYLRRGIDGQLGPGTRLAVRRLQFDLQNNAGTGSDGPAPVALTQYNRGVFAVTGIVDAPLAASIEAMLADPAFPKLPDSPDPAAANRGALAAVAAIVSPVAPTPYMLAIFQQESGGARFAVPSARDSDNFVVVGLDADPPDADRVTSRGYGLGQYTLFHHPPRPDEIAGFVADPVANVHTAYAELRTKFDGFVLGDTPATQADDRLREHPVLTNLRPCRYGVKDARYMVDCKNCAIAAAKRDIVPATPVYDGAAETYGDAPHYSDPRYVGVPDRADIPCDWPYAVRRYNGSGPDSYNYQARILLNLLRGPNPGPGAST
jgi:peptidoglycan hydrolase-like protein with peptidoglycan-binding domain